MPGLVVFLQGGVELLSGEIVVRLLGDRSSLREKLYACRRSDAERDVLLLTKVALLIRDKRLLQEKVTLMLGETKILPGRVCRPLARRTGNLGSSFFKGKKCQQN